ncbi:cation diffusion facilitator family transporter [Pseudoalteromonas mariniglutinosa]|uniref:cation diffusion facilitator family transporter n=1 Tax=Pseudoalteromonas mariniglutinosa TaxID=206042 RepID=UPI00384CC059
MAHSHGHTHDTHDKSNRQLLVAVMINVLLTVVQVIGGLLSGSLSLLADALHNLSDASAIFIAFVARKIGARPADEHYHFGYHRAEILATLLNSLSLILIGGYLIIEAVSNYFTPQPIDGWIIVWVAVVALLVDVATTFITYYAGAKNSINIRAAFIHNISDAMASLVVIVAGTLIILYQWYSVDLIATVLISLYVIYHGVLLLKQSCKILMQAAPADLDRQHIIASLTQQFAISKVDDLKVWQLDEHHLHCELKLTASADLELMAIKQFLQNQFSITHCTIEQTSHAMNIK